MLCSLDQLAIETAVPLMTQHDLQQMRKANWDFEQAIIANDTPAALAADDCFHGIPLAAADNPILSRVIEQLHPLVHRILYRKFSTLLGGRNTIEHHTQLIDACATGDARAAAELSGRNWTKLGGHINQLFDTNQLGL